MGNAPSLILSTPVTPSVVITNPAPLGLNFYTAPALPQALLSITGSALIYGPVVFSGQGGISLVLNGNTVLFSGAIGGGAGGSNVQITGSSVIPNANFTGIGGVSIFTSGGYILISGSAGGGSYDPLGTAANTGQALYGYVIGLSGSSVGTYATILNLTSSGVQLGNSLSALSGWATSQIASVQANLQSTGQNLQAQILGLSGANLTLYATILNLGLTGQILYGDITGLSGTNILTYATQINLTSSGVQLGISIISLSGWAASAANLIATGATLGSAINTLTTNLGLSGQALYADILGLSGQAGSVYATIANLFSTGSNLNLFASGISGNLGITGGVLYGYIVSLSGAHNTTIISTGQALFNDIIGLSGISATITNLGSTGSALYADIVGLSGISASSVNLFLTGSNLYNLIIGLSGLIGGGGASLVQLNSLSGFTTGMSGALQALIAGGGTVLKVTGSSNLINGNLTGIGGVSVVLSGGFIFISGGAAAGGSFDPLGTAANTGQILYNGLTGLSGVFAMSSFGLTIDAGTFLVSTGSKGCFQPDKSMTIIGWNIVAYTSGSIAFDIIKSNISTFPSFSSIIASGNNFPSLNGVNKAFSVSISGWNVNILPGDYLEFIVRGCTGIYKVNINITGTRS